ncbi:hypothetical protein [Fusobacterium ulcerans]|uniref:hypothetical protein n=2 Tax=Fusobacterium ulcerans TaxID=861 RepID=UPI00241F963E|nr:hypothetical protein [Fusobacterium ulcerans]
MNDDIEFRDFIKIINKFIGKSTNEFRYPLSAMTSLDSSKYESGRRMFIATKDEYMALIEQIFDDKLLEMENLHKSITKIK